MLQPPSIPSARMILRLADLSRLVLLVGQRLARRDHDAVAGVNAHRVDVLHVADGDAVVRAVAHHLVLDLLPADERLLDEHLPDGAGSESASDDLVELIYGVGDAAAGASERVRGPYNERQADVVHDPVGVFERLRDLRWRNRLPDAHQQIPEQLAVFGVAYGLKRRAEQPDVVLVQDAGVGQLDSQVESGLASERRQHAVRSFLRDDALENFDGQRARCKRCPRCPRRS